MLGIILLFSFAVSVSLLWLFGFAFYIYAHIGFSNLFGLPTAEITALASSALLPVFGFWLVIALVHNVLVLKRHEHTLDMLLAQTRRSADHAEVMVRTLMETQVQTHSAITLKNVPLFINELNDLLCDIVIRFGLVPAAHTEVIWQRIGDGNRWAFCKIILQHAENSSTFQENLTAQIRRDSVLEHLVRQFCYRFEQMFTMLDRHDSEHFLTKIFEEGAMGRVYLSFVEACRKDETKTSFVIAEEEEIRNDEPSEQISDFNDADIDEDVLTNVPVSEQEEPIETLPVEENTQPSSTAFGFLRPTR